MVVACAEASVAVIMFWVSIEALNLGMSANQQDNCSVEAEEPILRENVALIDITFGEIAFTVHRIHRRWPVTEEVCHVGRYGSIS